MSPMQLSDIDPRVDGVTQDEIVENRIARDELIARVARRGDPICQEAEALAAIALKMGCYGGSPWDEDLEEDDL